MSSNPSNLSRRAYREILKELAEREEALASRKVASKPSDSDLEKIKILTGPPDLVNKTGLFPQQREFFFEAGRAGQKLGRYRVARCTRRAGKTTGAAIKILVTLLRNPRAICLYVAKSTSVIRDQIWSELRQLVAQHDLPFDFHETQLRISHKRSTGRAIFRGASDAANIEKMRGLGVGDPFLLAILDESGSFGEHLENAVLSVITPGLRDYLGELLLIGTPPYFPAGLFYDADVGIRAKYKRWVRRHWTLQDNPFLREEARDPKAIMEDEGLTEDDPVYIREWLGQYCLNTKIQMFEYDPARNGYHGPPPPTLTYMLGVDFGWTDETAVVVLGMHPGSRKMWAVESWAAPEQTSDMVATKLQDFIRRYRPTRIVGDTGGYGKGPAEQIWLDYKIYIEQAKKLEKLNHVEFMNSAFRRGDLMVPLDDALDKELPKVLWAENKKDAHNKARDNRAMALLYVWRAANDMAGKGPTPADLRENPELAGWPDEEIAAKFALASDSPDNNLAWFLREV